ncbi:MAG TPA: SxtJ family membrane protein [Elusimicrobiota bacterium]|nr:SxtJ family membrane protein [Elusimicrobiota bacterium]
MLKVDWNPEKNQIQRFGIAWPVGVAIFGTVLALRHHVAAAGCLWVVAATVAVAARSRPAQARYVYILWMGLSAGIAFAVSCAALLVIFWGVVTPAALLFKLAGRDVLLRKKPAAESYWRDHESSRDASDYRHLF